MQKANTEETAVDHDAPKSVEHLSKEPETSEGPNHRQTPAENLQSNELSSDYREIAGLLEKLDEQVGSFTSKMKQNITVAPTLTGLAMLWETEAQERRSEIAKRPTPTKKNIVQHDEQENASLSSKLESEGPLDKDDPVVFI